MKEKARIGLDQSSRKSSVLLLNNRYQIISALGSGGFGDTYLARDTYLPSNSKCVIKRLRPTTQDAEIDRVIHQSFATEARILEKIGRECDRVPKLYAYFSENKQFFLAQEYIQGYTLEKLINSIGVTSEIQVKNILLNLLQTLQYLHSNEIIHRDIKPENIILRYPDLIPILIDFGSIKETMRSSGLALGTVVLGTPGYMPPEQQQGMPQFSSDIYSLGMTGIFLLTGKNPLELERDATGVIDWSQYGRISPSMLEVLQTATHPNLKIRYGSVEEMILAIHQHEKNQKTTLAIKLPDSELKKDEINPLISIVLIFSILLTVAGLFSQDRTNRPVNEKANSNSILK
ncbi:serine/threonine protein kinase (plasmid) [Nostoc sp. C052]|uniref:serine/threonine-protein kinase n=1 Tax=Nostoc sp. C052 TaxID=2576902 RepID=UPI0015C2E8D4|nr:serine/threonine-protein kinase [Nostoc sp. C052]QLE46512.1 serine/threonine protein kinase [Nostoc sp. C052]